MNKPGSSKQYAIDELEAKIFLTMDVLDTEDTLSLLKDASLDNMCIGQMEIQDIKYRTFYKLGLEAPAPLECNDTSGSRTAKEKNKRLIHRGLSYGIAAATILFLLLVGMNSDIMANAVGRMLSLIPGVGIVDTDQDARYRLKEPVSVDNKQCSLDILYVNATSNTMTVRFDLEGLLTDDTLPEKEKSGEFEYYKAAFDRSDIYLLINGKKFKVTNGGGGGGTSEYNFSYSNNYYFEFDQNIINAKKTYTLVCEKFNIKAKFKLVTLEQYSTLDEIGATVTHNDITLTATAFLDNNNLSVNVYPTNDTEDMLISFDREFDLEYFGKKMTLLTDKGEKEYTPPNYYGTGINSSFTFDVSDDADDFVLSIPFVVVETGEEKEITLPIPEEGEEVELGLGNEITFDKGIVKIKSVEKLAGDVGDENGYLKMNFEYESTDSNRQLVGIQATGKNAIGYYPEYDDQNRVKSISYMLNPSDKNEISIKLTNPRYVIMEEYQLTINPNEN